MFLGNATALICLFWSEKLNLVFSNRAARDHSTQNGASFIYLAIHLSWKRQPHVRALERAPWLGLVQDILALEGRELPEADLVTVKSATQRSPNVSLSTLQVLQHHLIWTHRV